MILSLAQIVKAGSFAKVMRLFILRCSPFTITTVWYIIKNVVFLLNNIFWLSKRIKEKAYENSYIIKLDYDAGHIQFGGGQSGHS
jgi:hypothetical protein